MQIGMYMHTNIGSAKNASDRRSFAKTESPRKSWEGYRICTASGLAARAMFGVSSIFILGFLSGAGAFYSAFS